MYALQSFPEQQVIRCFLPSFHWDLRYIGVANHTFCSFWLWMVSLIWSFPKGPSTLTIVLRILTALPMFLDNRAAKQKDATFVQQINQQLYKTLQVPSLLGIRNCQCSLSSSCSRLTITWTWTYINPQIITRKQASQNNMKNTKQNKQGKLVDRIGSKFWLP